MRLFDSTHIIFMLVTAAFLVLSSIAVSKMSRLWQDVAFAAAALICAAGIFYRYGMGLSWEGGIMPRTLLLELLQVCNFNFLLLPLCLVPRFKLARQYAVCFSMFAAATTFLSISSSFANYAWHDPQVLNSWINHVFAVACPLWMLVSGRERPSRKYLPWVSLCVFAYFTIVYLISEALIGKGIITEATSFSFIYKTDGIPLLDQFHAIIPYPYFHLYPVHAIYVFFLMGICYPFNKSVFFKANGSKGIMLPRHGYHGESVTLTRSGFFREGYNLVGFSETPEGEVVLPLGSALTIGKKNLVLYAIWEKVG